MIWHSKVNLVEDYLQADMQKKEQTEGRKGFKTRIMKMIVEEQVRKKVVKVIMRI